MTQHAAPIDAAADPAQGFRHQLRVSTQVQHQRTETAFAAFTEAMPGRLTWFLAAQRAGLAALLESCDAPDLASRHMIADLLRRLDADLAGRGARHEGVAPAGPLDPLAVDYIVLGSRLGTEVMRRALAQRLSPQEMPTYFAAPDARPLWKAHCAELEEIWPDSDRAGQIIADAELGFELFQLAAGVQDTVAERAA
ncbi:heme oxygenase-like domain-containing protein [Mangrovicoccus ximenensis]|uniref:hypothetical protein n=1 Tax=Mangrovicoccus ximenensis TaxID=1911570 RepID=UPI001F3A6132|nr:hypothetical protein [Mangrovicoccus ximenensis]